MPQTPTGLTVRTGDTIADVVWDTSTDQTVVGFNVYMGGIKISGDAPISNAIFRRGLANGTPYTFEVRSVTAGDVESAGAFVTFTPGDAAPISIADAITQSAIDGIQSVTTDGQTTTKMSVRDQIAADQYAAAKRAANLPFGGIRRVKILGNNAL